MPTPAPVLRTARRFVPVVLVVAALATGSVFAQDEEPHPAHIHAGTCDALGDVVFPLSDVDDAAAAGTPASSANATPADPAASSTTTVAATLDDLLATPHAINVHLSADEIGTYIACGEIAGSPAGGRFTVELAELNDSGHSGEAALESAGGETVVAILLHAAADGATGGTPMADSEQAAQGALVVDIVNFAYDPNPVTVPVGGSVTWTNSDPVPHTATARDRDVLQTGTIRNGESVTVTFDAVGSWDYFCEFHSGMKATLVVE